MFNASNMETGLDNANPFSNSNGSLKNLDADTDNINLQKNNDGLLLNLTDNFKTNGTDLSHDFFEKSNGPKKSASDINFDDDFGPETDVDAVDDAFSPVDKEKSFAHGLAKALEEGITNKSLNDEVKALTEGLANNNPLGDPFNPFSSNQTHQDHNNDEAKDTFNEFHKEDREETPTPPADAVTVHDVGGLEVNPAESDSEDEWNYIKGDQAKANILPSQPETVVETSEQEDDMSQLNPNAAEFVPVSPTRSIPSPACRALMNDEVISQSPKRPPARVDISVPSATEFESEVKSRPSDFDYKNGIEELNDSHNTSETDNIENLLNGKSIDEIPEFHPGSTPTKQASEEFHFGPNAAPFTPKALDQSEAFSTKANYGDDTEQTLNTSFNDSEIIPNKEQIDPMSMSFYAEKGESNPFQDNEDLNKVHELPENLDAFLQETDLINKENYESNSLEVTMSDLPGHAPLGKHLDNDQAAVQTTDLDKLSQDDEKELASPLEDLDEPLNLESVDNKLSISPMSENLELQDERVQSATSNVESVPERGPVPTKDSNPFENQHELANAPPNAALDLLDNREVRLESQDLTCSLKHELASIKGDFEELKSSVSELKSEGENLLGDFNPKNEVESINLETAHDVSLTPEPACAYSEETESCEPVSQGSTAPAALSHTELLMEEKHDEVTSSIKDDVSSPIEQLSSPIQSPECVLEEQAKLVESDVNVVEANTDIQSHEISSQELLSDFSCPMPSFQPTVPPSESNEENLLKTIASVQKNEPGLSNGFDNSVTEINEQICIKTESITPEFAEPAIITPSEESRAMDEVVPSAVKIPQETIDLTSPEPRSQSEIEFTQPERVVPEPELTSVPAESVTSHVELQKDIEPSITMLEEQKPVDTLTEAPTVSSEAPKEIAKPDSLPLLAPTVESLQVADKKSPVATSAKKPIGKVEPRKSLGSTPKVGSAKPSPKPAASSKTGVIPKVPARLGAPKPAGPGTKTTSSLASKAPAKPKTAPLSKPTEKKPASATEVRPTPRTALTKKPVTTTTAPKTLTRPASSTEKTSTTTKPAAPRPITAPRTSAPKTSSSAAPKPAPASAKPRVPLSGRPGQTAAGKTASSMTTAAKTTTSTTASSRPASGPKAAAAPPKPRTITCPAPKPRVPLTKTVTKSADVEKEKKESANKLTASRMTTVTKTTSGTATSRTTTTVKKTEIKPLSERTIASKTTTTKTALNKKSGDAKAPASKTKTTKIEKPKQNGVVPTNITEEIKEITIVNNVVNETETENLVKDNSPLDNKLLIETNNALIDVNPAD